MSDNLTIIIPYYNGREYINNLLATIPDDVPVIIVDDVSDQPLQLNKPKNNLSIFRLTSKGYFTGAVNFGIKQCDTDVLILNQDVLLSDGWKATIESNKGQYGLIGERIKGKHPVFPHGYIHGTFMFIRRDVIDKVGLMNSDLYPLWGSTAEYQLRVSRAGFKVLPLVDVNGFKHLRVGNFGKTIKATINKSGEDKKRLINTPPEISVIIPAYNFGKYLDDAVASLIGGDSSLGYQPGQTFQSFEVILVDDGSTDDTPEIMKKYVDGWNGIKYIKIDRKPIDKNGRYIGKPSALNAGIQNANGKYITILDADDMMHQNRLKIMYETMSLNPDSVVYDDLVSFKCWEKVDFGQIDRNFTAELKTELIDLSDKPFSTVYRSAVLNKHFVNYNQDAALKYWTLPDYDFDRLINKNCMHIGIMYPKKAWQSVGGYPNMKYGREDWAFNVALGQAGFCGVHIKQGLYLYRREGQNRTLVNSKADWMKRFKQQMIELYPRLYEGEFPMACCGRGASKKANKNLGKQYTENNIAMAQKTPSSGTTLVKYEGKKPASFTAWGAATGTPYRVDPKAPIFPVDNADLPSILNMYEANKYAFNEYKQAEPVKTVIVDVVEEVVINVEDFEEAGEAIVEGVVGGIVEGVEVKQDLRLIGDDEFKTLSPTVDAAVKHFDDDSFQYDIADLEAWIAYEEANKNRVTLVAFLKEKIDEFTGVSIVGISDI